MESLTHRGLVKRTVLMTSERAWSFGTCLMANRRFSNVSIVHSSRATGEARYFVQYIPTNPDRQQEMKDRAEGARAVRAYEEGSDYLWVPDHGANGPFLWLVSKSGEVYEVNQEAGTCSCPDFHYRCSGAGLKCKHLIALDLGMGAVQRIQTIPAGATTATAEDRKAAARADIDSLGL